MIVIIGMLIGCWWQSEMALPQQLDIAMHDYRLYFMTDCGLHIDRFEPIHADGDRSAIEAAARHRGRQPLELWWRDRKVRVFAASRTGSAKFE